MVIEKRLILTCDVCSQRAEITFEDGQSDMEIAAHKQNWNIGRIIVDNCATIAPVDFHLCARCAITTAGGKNGVNERNKIGLLKRLVGGR